MARRLWCEYEIVSSTHAVVSFRTTDGEWAGAGRVEVRIGSLSALREECYRVASMCAASKGLVLDRFSEAAHG